MNKNLFSAEMKIQYLVNIGRSPISAECRPSPITRVLSVPSSSVCAVATYSAEAPPRMHQNSPFSDKKIKKFMGRGHDPPQTPPHMRKFQFNWGGIVYYTPRDTPSPHPTALGAEARTPQL